LGPSNYGTFFLPPWLELKQFAFTCAQGVQKRHVVGAVLGGPIASSGGAQLERFSLARDKTPAGSAAPICRVEQEPRENYVSRSCSRGSAIGLLTVVSLALALKSRGAAVSDPDGLRQKNMPLTPPVPTGPRSQQNYNKPPHTGHDVR